MAALNGRPIVFGEVLFDQFEDGAAVLGGAPFNVVWHLNGFGLDPLLISRVGDDDLGRAVIDAMRSWQLDPGGLQVDNHHPTGRVNVTLHDGQPSFDIVPQQAYDFIDETEALHVAKERELALLYFGSLITRHAQSRQALHTLQQKLSVPSFVDINLRPPWWTREVVDQALRLAHWLKLNDQELLEIMPAAAGVTVSMEQQAIDLAQQFHLERLIVTLGDKGAFIIEGGQCIRGEPVAVEQLIDTVGAGDAFSAVTILGLMNDWPATDILHRAMEFAAAICAIRGATSQDHGLYERFMTRWGCGHG